MQPGALEPAPGAASESSSRVQATLHRNSTGRFNLALRHDSRSGSVAIESVGPKSPSGPDGRAAVRENDTVSRVNGVETVRTPCHPHGSHSAR